MTFLVGSFSLMAMLLTMICCRSLIQKETVKNQQLKSLRGERPIWDEELEKSLWERFLRPVWKRLMEQVSKMAKSRRRNPAKSKSASTQLENDLHHAGIRIGGAEFMFIRLLVTAAILLFGFIGAMEVTDEVEMQFLVVLLALTAAVAAPPFYLRARIKSRQQTIQNQMPSVMDVLGVSIEAGLGFDAALLKVIERFKGPLIDELNQVYREIQMGTPKREALAALNQRSNVSELQTFASAIIQSEQFGTPMKNVLRSQAQQLRVSRRQQAQEKGMKAPVRMMLPMVIFIFPVIFIILLGPTIINAIGNLS
ncbi:MAG: type II secretion system F family protein [Clostridiaceae bacterium]|nr:type II secretion system F family protein [Clostridiaceae bacterium]